MEEKIKGCGCGSRAKRIFAQPATRRETRKIQQPINKVYKTRTKIFN